MFRKIGIGEKNVCKHLSIRHVEEEKNFLLLLGFESQVVQLVGYSLYWLHCPHCLSCGIFLQECTGVEELGASLLDPSDKLTS